MLCERTMPSHLKVIVSWNSMEGHTAIEMKGMGDYNETELLKCVPKVGANCSRTEETLNGGASLGKECVSGNLGT